MGGLICEKCRIILFFPDSEEFKKEFKNSQSGTNEAKTEQIAGRDE